MSTETIPQVFDATKRWIRTGVQVAAAFASFAALYPVIVHALGVPASSTVGIWLATVGVWVTAVAAAISRIMAIPAINGWLANLGLAGHSGQVEPLDTLTRLNAAVPATPSSN